MTTFWRSSYWRRSKYGVWHEVQGHSVSRYGWDRSSSLTSAALYFRERLNGLHAGGSTAASFTIPNAECPVCGANVFFYQNTYGSRVYFDDLGPPWPKHPCTDNAYRDQSAISKESIQPVIRGDDEIRAISDWIGYAGIDPARSFEEKYGLSPWKPFKIERRLSGKFAAILILRPLDAGASDRLLFLKRARLPKFLKPDSLAFFHRGWLACFDHDRLEPVELEMQRLTGPGALVRELV